MVAIAINLRLRHLAYGFKKAWSRSQIYRVNCASEYPRIEGTDQGEYEVKNRARGSVHLFVGVLTQILVVAFMSPLTHAAPPAVPAIDSVYSATSTSATVIFYGEVATIVDLKTTYVATSTPDNKVGSISLLGENGRGVIVVNGLQPNTEYTFTVAASNSDGYKISLPSSPIITLSTTPVALKPIFGETTSTNTGFTTKILNYDSSYTYTLSADKGTAAIDTDGLITVSNIGYSGEFATIVVTTTRTGYDTATATLSASSRKSPETSKLSVKNNPTLVLIGNKATCTVGSFDFYRNSKYLETAQIEATVVFLEINSVNVSIYSSDNFETTPRFMFPSFTDLTVGTGTKSVITWDLTGITKKYPIRCKAMAFQEGVSVTGTSPTIVDPTTAVTKAKRTTITCKKGTVVRKVNAVNPKCAPGFIQVP